MPFLNIWLVSNNLGLPDLTLRSRALDLRFPGLAVSSPIAVVVPLAPFSFSDFAVVMRFKLLALPCKAAIVCRRVLPPFGG